MITLQNLTVKETYGLDDENPVVLNLTDAFTQVIHNFANHAEIRGVFVVDDNHQFAGIITRTDLLDWARVKLGAAFIQPLMNTDKTIRLANLFNALTVVEVLRPETKNAAVSTGDTLAHALKLMIELDLIILPVIDASQQIIGSLTLSELLIKVLTASQ